MKTQAPSPPSSLLLVLALGSALVAVSYFYRAHVIDAELQPLIVEQDEYFQKVVEDMKGIQAFKHAQLSYEDELKARRREWDISQLAKQKESLEIRGWAFVGLTLLFAGPYVFLRLRGATATPPLTLRLTR